MTALVRAAPLLTARLPCRFPGRPFAIPTIPTARPFARGAATLQQQPSPCAGGISSEAILSPDLPLLEEEKYPNYDPCSYYPARVGEVLRGKYKLISKLGWGMQSTIWLAQDVRIWRRFLPARYVALKITNSSTRDSAQTELEISQHMSRIRSRHGGEEYVRLVLDSFDVDGPHGRHLCLAFEPLREPLWMLARHHPHRHPHPGAGGGGGGGGKVPHEALRAVMPMVLDAVDFMHRECHVIHTDLKGDHIMMPFENAQVLKDYVRHQSENPPRVVERGGPRGGRPVYESRGDFGKLRGRQQQQRASFVKLVDFGLAIRGGTLTRYFHDIQPVECMAPEVILRTGWSFPADIWNLGLVMWELLGEQSLLNGRPTRCPNHPDFSPLVRWAQMIRLLGPPPQEMLDKADKHVREQLYDDNGTFRHPHLMPPEADFSFEKLTPIPPGREKDLFLDFARMMLTWDPDERATARELRGHPWIKEAPVLL